MMADKQLQFVNTTKDNSKMKTDKNRIYQVLRNLIANSVDFVPEKGRIEIGAQSNGDEISMYVKDNGVGIPKEKQENLFKKFYQIDTSMKRKHGGTGLGLSISKGIVEGLGGKICLKAKLGKELPSSLPCQG
jgi:signal transduction histidine kinase